MEVDHLVACKVHKPGVPLVQVARGEKGLEFEVSSENAKRHHHLLCCLGIGDHTRSTRFSIPSGMQTTVKGSIPLPFWDIQGLCRALPLASTSSALHTTHSGTQPCAACPWA